MPEKHTPEKHTVKEQLLEEIDTDATQAALAWLKSRWKIWAVLAAASIGAVVVTSAWSSYSASHEAKAQAVLAACVKAAEGPAETADTGVASCDAVIDAHGGSIAARHARLLKGALLQRAGKADQAVQTLTPLASETPKSDPLHGVVKLALARAQEAAGKHAEAAATEKALRDEGFSLEEHTTFDIVRALEASGQLDEARKLLEAEIAKAEAAGPAGAGSSMLRARLALLGVAPPPAPQAAPTSPPPAP